MEVFKGVPRFVIRWVMLVAERAGGAWLLVSSVRGPSVEEGGELGPDEAAGGVFTNASYDGVQVVERCVRA